MNKYQKMKYAHCGLALVFLIFFLYFMYSTGAHFTKANELYNYGAGLEYTQEPCCDLHASQDNPLKYQVEEYATAHIIVGFFSLIGGGLTGLVLVLEVKFIEDNLIKGDKPPSVLE